MVHKTGGKIKIRERFDCEVLCSQRDEFLDEQRTRRGCTRIDLPPIGWDVDAKRIHAGGWMGRHPVREKTQAGVTINPKFPTEDPADGCPGGWYRSHFVASVIPYLRRRDANGGRVANLMLDRIDDDLVIALVAYTEDEQERWESYRLEACADV